MQLNNGSRHRKSRPVPHCKVLPHGKLNNMNDDPNNMILILIIISHESFITIAQPLTALLQR